jgi:hypothetical protein
VDAAAADVVVLVAGVGAAAVDPVHVGSVAVPDAAVA